MVDSNTEVPDTNRPKNALITGASRRIGAAIARSLSSQGVNVIIHHNDSGEEAQALATELEQMGGKAIALQADLTDIGSTRQLFDDAVNALGPIDLLVNNASVFEPDTALDFNEELWATHFAIHVQTPSILSSQLAKQASLNEGLIVNLIDQRVWNLNPTFYSYTLSKSALWTATRTLAQSLAPRVRVNAIGPGPTLPNERQSQADFDRQVAGLPLEAAPRLEEFGETVLWLWQAKSVTGQMIALDGGQHLAWQTPDIAGINE